ncbi:MAG: ABC transporter permease [Nitrospinota bacterium]|nr:ABC transporter permease [Nitrospinota bacterium]
MKIFDFYIISVNLVKKLRVHGGTIKSMAITEIRSRYVDTIGGLIWALIHPLLVILVYWFVFSVGFKITPPGGVPFILVFLSGFIPWIIFNETLMGNTNVLQTHSHLVTKTVFPTEILPVIRLLVSMVTHFVMLFFLLIIMFVLDVSFSIYNFQFIYYLFALTVLILGLSWLCSSVNLFFRDTAQILQALLPLWFWLTPIVWFRDMIPDKYQWILDLNPLVYIVEGYKKSFIYHSPFWEDLPSAANFWAVGILAFVIGGLVFRKLKPEFAEVL